MASDRQIIYLDNNATTAPDPAVIEEMMPFLTSSYANPSSGYAFAGEVRDAIEVARQRVAGLLNCEPDEIVFTSGGTEANNTALNSAVQRQAARRHIVTTAVEHSAVRVHCQELGRRGYDVTFVSVDADGSLSVDQVEKAIRPDTAVVSVMWANNETGVLFPVEEIAALARDRGALFHTDAVQAAGKVPIQLKRHPMNFVAISGHKLHAPKGVGALYVDRRSHFHPTLFGGSHENGRRAGTENVTSIVGFGKAAEIAAAALNEEAARLHSMRDRFERHLLAAVPQSFVNGRAAPRLPNTTSFTFPGIESDAALMMLDRHGVCCSAGSACRTGSLQPSHVLRAMGLSVEEARASLRFSFGRFNTDNDVEKAMELVPQVIGRLRKISGAVLEGSTV